MTLPSSPPRFPTWSSLRSSIKQGESGWRVYALQKGVGASPDGAFGPLTLNLVKAYQRSKKLLDDGIAGVATQGSILKDAEVTVHKIYFDLPEGTLRGFAEAEGAGVLAATNWFTPNGAKPGVDCGPVQWRQAGPPFDQDGLRKAFDTVQAFDFAADILLSRVTRYRKINTKLTFERAVELAVLAHNWPSGAEQLVKYGKFVNPNALATWTVKPDGGHYTFQEWSVVYPARVLKYVKF